MTRTTTLQARLDGGLLLGLLARRVGVFVALSAYSAVVAVDLSIRDEEQTCKYDTRDGINK